MDFKDRFKGRTTVIRKEGVIDTFSDSNNPVQKSQSNSQLSSYSRMSPQPTSNFQMHNSPNPRQNTKPTLDNKPGLPLYPTSSNSRTPGSNPHTHTNKSQPPRIQQTQTSNSNNPYFVHNPFPTLDITESHNYGGDMQAYNRFEPMTQKNVAHSLNNNEFNPNNFYNQHSQYRGGVSASQTPKDAQQGQAINYGPSSNQMHKQNFENMSQQHKQKRMAEEAMRGFENPGIPYRVLNNRYGEYDQGQGMPSYNPQQMKPPLPGQGYNGPRNIHSNPGSHSGIEANPNDFFPGNLTHQVERGRQQADINPFYAANSEAGSGQNKTGYKPYTLKEYQEVKGKGPMQLGGLGPNTNTTEWQKEKEKRDKMLEFSQNVKMFNAHRGPGTENSFKPNQEKVKEKSRRDVALDFAKNVPKPKPTRRNSSPTNPVNHVQKKAESDKGYGDFMNELDAFEQRHKQYVSELEKMKFV